MNVGLMNKRVLLGHSPKESNDADGFIEPLKPESVAAAIQPLAPGTDERSITHLVTMRYHPQVDLDTWIRYTDALKGYTRQLRVRGVQDVDERHAELRLLCEEVLP